MIPRQRFSILCVDDNTALLDVLEDRLGGAGYEVHTASNGFAALNHLSRDPGRFDLVITDLRMPGLDGVGLIEQARAAGYSNGFIVYAAIVGSDHRSRFNELRVRHVIEKPGRPGELLEAIRECQIAS
jgi:CheY-like chemotaxis protein